MAVMLAISLATSILFGLFPALEATSIDLRSALAEGGRSGAGSRRQWKRQALVFAEVALGVVLVIGAGLLIRTLTHLMNLNPGFNPDHVVTASLSLQDARYKTSSSVARLFRESLARIREIPGVESAAVMLNLPYEQALNTNVQNVSGRPITRDGGLTNFIYGTPEMFATLQMPLLRGRVFRDSDGATSLKVAVVNEAFLKHYVSPGQDPLGSQLEMMGGGAYQIIGIVPDVPQQHGWGDQVRASYGLASDVRPYQSDVRRLLADGAYLVLAELGSPHSRHCSRSPRCHAPRIAVDPRLPFSAFHSMAEVHGQSLNEQRYQAVLFSALAGLAILLAALGVYGLIAQSVAQRTREMGIRLALGATVGRVIGTAVTPGILLSVADIVAGLVLALFVTRLLKSFIWGVTATDPITFLSVAVLLILSPHSPVLCQPCASPAWTRLKLSATSKS
jgi:predicted permease